jgi:hypothetical protein
MASDLTRIFCRNPRKNKDLNIYFVNMVSANIFRLARMTALK